MKRDSFGRNLAGGLGLPVAILAILAAPVRAGNEDILDLLDGDDYLKRQAATQRLLADESLSLASIAEAHAAARSPEQRHRLLAVAKHHTLRHLRLVRARPHDTGAIGLTHEIVPAGEYDDLHTPAIHVMVTLAGFPGHVHLEADDLIIAFEGNPLPDDLGRRGFNNLLKNRRSGKTVSLTVLRDGQRHTIDLRLAGLSELTSFYDQTTLGVRQPFQNQWLEVRAAIVGGLALPQLPELPETASIDNRQ